MKCEAFERERATLVSSQNRCVVGKAERDSSQIYSYEVEARNDEAALKAEELFNGDIYTMYVYLM